VMMGANLYVTGFNDGTPPEIFTPGPTTYLNCCAAIAW
jgi:hypothetical protein